MAIKSHLLQLINLVAMFNLAILIAEHKSWIKMNENLLNRQLITCIIRL